MEGNLYPPPALRIFENDGNLFPVVSMSSCEFLMFALIK